MTRKARRATSSRTKYRVHARRFLEYTLTFAFSCCTVQLEIVVFMRMRREIKRSIMADLPMDIFMYGQISGTPISQQGSILHKSQRVTDDLSHVHNNGRLYDLRPCETTTLRPYDDDHNEYQRLSGQQRSRRYLRFLSLLILSYLLAISHLSRHALPSCSNSRSRHPVSDSSLLFPQLADSCLCLLSLHLT